MAEGNDHQQDEEEERMLPRSPVIWRGSLELYGRRTPIHLRLISGNSRLPKACIPLVGDPPVLRMKKTVKLDDSKLKDIARKTQLYDQHTILIGLPEQEEDAMTVEKLRLAQRMKTTFVDFLSARQSVGLALLYHSSDAAEKFTLHAFPQCRFSDEYVARLLPDAFLPLRDTAYLLFILTRDSPTETDE